jgi:hypothetical protein
MSWGRFGDGRLGDALDILVSGAFLSGRPRRGRAESIVRTRPLFRNVAIAETSGPGDRDRTRGVLG